MVFMTFEQLYVISFIKEDTFEPYPFFLFSQRYHMDWESMQLIPHDRDEFDKKRVEKKVGFYSLIPLIELFFL